jgi:hypothetical protein
MVSWIIVVLLLVLLFIQNQKMIRHKMYMADYVLIMFADEEICQVWRKGFLDTAKTWNAELRDKHLWLHANTSLTRFIPDWGKKHGSPVAAGDALKEWLLQEGVIKE